MHNQSQRIITSMLAAFSAMACSLSVVPSVYAVEATTAPSQVVAPDKTPNTVPSKTPPTDPKVKPSASKVITPNKQFPTAKTKQEANEQVGSVIAPQVTYHLSVNMIDTTTKKPFKEPYKITLASSMLNSLKDKCQYIELPQAQGYAIDTKSSNLAFYIKDEKSGTYVKDDGKADASKTRYLRVDKALLESVCKSATPMKHDPVTPVKPVVTPVKPVTPAPKTPLKAADPKVMPVKPVTPQGVLVGNLTVNYTARVATFYVRHLLQDANDPTKFTQEYADAAKTVIFVRKNSKGEVEKIHVTKHEGIVGTTAHSQSINIPGYMPEHKGTSAPVSDGNNLVLTTRYYRRTYAVTYDTDGGNRMVSHNIYLGNQIPVVKDPVKRGYIFKGWQLSDTASIAEHLKMNENGKDYGEQASFAMPAHDVCFKAKWEANPVTQYRVNVWVQKPDLVDKSNPESKVNYDFVTAIARPGIKTGSEVSVDKMNDAGVVDGNISGTEASPVDGSSVGFKSDELTNGIIAKFNWMGDKPCTSLSGYNTADPYDPNNKGKDLFTRYFHVNKELTKKFNAQTKLDPNDLKNQFDIVYDRTVYDLIFAGSKEISEQTKSDVSGLGSIELKPLRTNAGVYRMENGKKKLYCYPNNQNADTLVHDKSEYNGAEVVHDAYRAKVRYGQDLHGVMPLTDDILYEITLQEMIQSLAAVA